MTFNPGFLTVIAANSTQKGICGVNALLCLMAMIAISNHDTAVGKCLQMHAACIMLQWV